jgi:DNA-binding GntR family transcriptional regulator
LRRRSGTLCTNSWQPGLHCRLYLQSERYRRLSGPIDNAHRDIVAELAAIANAALARDAGAACKAPSDHLNRTTEIILRADVLFADHGAPRSAG